MNYKVVILELVEQCYVAGRQVYNILKHLEMTVRRRH